MAVYDGLCDSKSARLWKLSLCILKRRGRAVLSKEEELIQLLESPWPEAAQLLSRRGVGEMLITKEDVIATCGLSYGDIITDIIFGLDETRQASDATALLFSLGRQNLVEYAFRRGKIPITKETAMMAMSYRNVRRGRVLDIFLKQEGAESAITSEVMVKAASVAFDGYSLTEKLLARANRDLSVTENIMEAAAKNEGGNKIIGLLQASGKQAQITEKVAAAAAGHIYGKQRLEFLVAGGELQLGQETMVAAGRHWKVHDFKELLNRTSRELVITEDLMTAAGSNAFPGRGILDLLKRTGQYLPITP